MMEPTTPREPRKPRDFHWLKSPESPMSMYMRRDDKKHLVGWSKLRFMLDWCCLVFTYSIITDYAWTHAAVIAFLGIPGMLVAEQVAARIPFSEIMGAVQAGATWVMSKGAEKARDVLGTTTGSQVTETTERESEKTTRTASAPPTSIPSPAEEV